MVTQAFCHSINDILSSCCHYYYLSLCIFVMYKLIEHFIVLNLKWNAKKMVVILISTLDWIPSKQTFYWTKDFCFVGNSKTFMEAWEKSGNFKEWQFWILWNHKYKVFRYHRHTTAFWSFLFSCALYRFPLLFGCYSPYDTHD